jgi:hypothetical protein
MATPASCPALIDILTYLGLGRDGFWDIPSSKDHELAIGIITSAAQDAYKKEKPLNRQYAVAHLEIIGPRQSIRECTLAMVDKEKGLESFGELVGAIEWICQRINRLTGISVHEISETIERCSHDKPLDAVYGETRTSLNHVATRLRELDSDGTTGTIWHRVWRGCSIIRRVFELNGKPVADKSHEPATPTGPRVVLGKCSDAPIVNGKKKVPLTPAQYDVVKALLDAGENGLTKDLLDRNSKHGDARKILARIANKDDDWKGVIHFPGITGGRYRIF